MADMESSYLIDNLAILEEKQKLQMALERFDLSSEEMGQTKPSPLDQYRFLVRLLHVTPSKEYLNCLEAHFFDSNIEYDNSSVGTELIFDRTYIGTVHWIAIFLTISGCTRIQKISFCRQRLTSVLVEMMCRAVEKLPNLYSLDLSYNSFGSTGVMHLTALSRKKPLLVYCGFNGIQCISSVGRKLEESILRNRQPFLAVSAK